MGCYCLLDSPKDDPMGAKRPSGTVFDTLSNINTSDRKFQPGGKVSLDPSPRQAMSAKLEKGRDGSHDEDWRREREMEKTRDKATYRDHGPRDRCYERHQGPVPRQREWSERERWQEHERRQNVRPLSTVEKETERYAARGTKKGDTFPRVTKNSGDHDRRVTRENDGSGERGRRDRPKRLDADDWEREYEREHQRERCRVKDREDMPGRLKKEGHRRRERDDSWERKERDTARRREKPRSDMGKREHRVASPYRQRERDIYSDRVEREATYRRRQGQRDTRSEGDSDEREMRKERDRERDREYQYSRSDGDSRDKPKTDRDRDRQGYRVEDKYRYRDGDREREVDRSRRRDEEKDRERYREDQRRVSWEADRGKERWKDSNRDLRGDRRRRDVCREPTQEIYRERKEKEEEQWREDSSGRDGRAQSDTAPRAPPRAQSSGEWSSTDVDEQRTAELDVDRRRREQDRHRRGKTEQRRMWLEPQRGKNSGGNFVDTRTSEKNIESQGECGRGEQRVKEEPDEHYSDQSHRTERDRSRNEQSGNTKTEGVSVDGEMYEVWREKDKEEGEQMSGSHRRIDGRHDAEPENMMEESDREDEGGSDYWARSESEGGSDSGWKQEKDKMLSGEDDFVTISSGGDEQDEREEDEERYEDCQEYLEGGDKDHSPGDFVGHDGDNETEQEWRTRKGEETVDEDDQDSEKQPQYVFCVIGQTLPREKAIKKTPPEADHLTEEDRSGDPNTKWRDQGAQRASAQEAEINTNLETEDTMRGKILPQADLGPISRDSLTERLLMEWRQKNNEPFETEKEHSLQVPDNPYGDVYSQVDFEQIQPILEGISSGMMSPEEVEAIRIRLSGAWTLSEEPKQRSQAPHLKWAKNVVREILGNSEEGTVDETGMETDGDRRVNQSENTSNNVKQQVETLHKTGEVPLDLRMDAQHSDAELDMDESLELEGLRGMGQSCDDMHVEQVTAMHGDACTYIHADTQLYTGGKEEHSIDKESSPSGHQQLEKLDIMVETCEKSGDCEISETEKSKREEVEMYLSVSNTLYKPSSCPILICETESETLVSSSEGEGKQVPVGQDRTGESEEDGQEEERDIAEGMVGSKEGEEGDEPDEHVSDPIVKGATLKSSYSFRDLGPKARLRRRGVRKTTERKDGKHVEVKEEEGVGRDRRTRIFSATGKDRIIMMTFQSSISF